MSNQLAYSNSPERHTMTTRLAALVEQLGHRNADLAALGNRAFGDMSPPVPIAGKADGPRANPAGLPELLDILDRHLSAYSEITARLADIA